MVAPNEPMCMDSFTSKSSYKFEGWETEWVRGQPLQSPALGTIAPSSLSPLSPETFCCDSGPLASSSSDFTNLETGMCEAQS